MPNTTNNLEAMLDRYLSATLKQIAAANQIDTTDNQGKNLTKTPLVKKLARELFTPNKVQQNFARLSDIERTVLQAVQRAPQQSIMLPLLKSTLLYANYLDPTPEDTTTLWRKAYKGSTTPKTSKVLEDILARLTQKGLIFSDQDPDANKMSLSPGKLVFIPPAIQPYLPPPPTITQKTKVISPGYVQTTDPQAFIRNLYLYWDYVRQNGLDLLKAGVVGKRGLKAVNAVLLTPSEQLQNAKDETQVFWLYQMRQLLTHLNLIDSQGQTLVSTTPIEAIPSFWAHSLASQVSQCFEIVLNNENLPTLTTNDYDDYNLTPTTAKATLLKLLKPLSAQVWLQFSQLMEELQLINMNFLYPHHSAILTTGRGTDYIYERIEGQYYSGSKKRILETMQKNEQQFVQQFIVQILHPLGLVDLGWQTKKPETDLTNETFWAIALTPLGHAILNQQAPRIEADNTHQGSIIIQPDFQIMALGPVPTHILAQLDMLAQREKVDANAFTYRLTRESVYQAKQYGITASQVAEKLDNLSEVPLANNIKRSLAEWGAQHQRINFQHGVTFIEAADTALIQQVEEALQDSQPQRLSDTMLKLPALPPNDLTEALLARNLPPRTSYFTRESLETSIHLTAEGLIEPVSALPNLKLRQLLDSFAEPLEGNRWQLTQKSVQAYLSRPSELQTWLNTLQTLSGDDLPAELVIRLKKWSGYYGQANLQTLTLLTFDSAAILQELRQHPQLGDHLKPLPGLSQSAESKVAVVAEDDVAHVKQVLAELGVAISEK